MYGKIFSLISLLALSSATFAENEQAIEIQNQQNIVLSNEPTISAIPAPKNDTLFASCSYHNFQKIMKNLKLPETNAEYHYDLVVELKEDGRVKSIQINGRNNDIIVKALKKAIYKSAPFETVADESKAHLCNKIEFSFLNKY
ncbi:hypothetical protein [Acinetobacter sp. P8-3-8]|uniref:hypothetical protein n=1 Tax=Acinetobacter sp. P8-3-8 TaxID=1029823 RepID=UPI000248764B|nr:hypothetical protein [Acinetobacter sp. P8-3-8]